MHRGSTVYLYYMMTKSERIIRLNWFVLCRVCALRFEFNVDLTSRAHTHTAHSTSQTKGNKVCGYETIFILIRKCVRAFREWFSKSVDSWTNTKWFNVNKLERVHCNVQKNNKIINVLIFFKMNINIGAKAICTPIPTHVRLLVCSDLLLYKKNRETEICIVFIQVACFLDFQQNYVEFLNAKAQKNYLNNFVCLPAAVQNLFYNIKKSSQTGCWLSKAKQQKKQCRFGHGWEPKTVVKRTKLPVKFWWTNEKKKNEEEEWNRIGYSLWTTKWWAIPISRKVFYICSTKFKEE